VGASAGEHPTVENLMVLRHMINNRARGLAILNCFILSVTAGFIFWAWVIVFFHGIRSEAPASYFRYTVYSLVVMGAFGIDYVMTKIRAEERFPSGWLGTASVALRQTAVAAGCLLLFLTAVRDNAISRVFLFSFLPLLILLLVPLNRYVPRLLSGMIFHGKRRQRTLLYGSWRHAHRLTDWLSRKADYGLDVVGVVSDLPAPEQFPFAVLGRTRDLAAIVRNHGVTQVIALDLPNSIPRAARIAGHCEKLGVRLLMINDIEQRFERPVRFFQDDGVHFVGFRDEPLECPVNRALKRATDVAIALPCLLFVLPILCLTVLVIQRVQSPGPLFYRQRRTGIHFQPFDIFKFRTMHAGDHDETRQATAGDVRVFPLGAWLRRLSLDEVPQIINVLKGEMSIVGPRPHMLEHDDVFEQVADSYRVRSMVKPGITGLAQVQGQRGEIRSTEDIVDRVRSDVFYLENWSMELDWRIILQTALHLVRPPKTAY